MSNYSVQNILNVFQKQEELYLERITQKEKQCRDYIKSYVNYNGLDPIDKNHQEFIQKYRMDNSYIHFKKKDERLRRLAEISEVSNTWKPPKEFFEWFKESKYITEEYVLNNADEHGFYLNEDLAAFRKMGAMDTDVAILSRIPIVMPYRKRLIHKKDIIDVDQYIQIKNVESVDEFLEILIIKNPRNANISNYSILEIESYKGGIEQKRNLAKKKNRKIKINFDNIKSNILNLFTTDKNKNDKDYKKPKFNNIRRVIERYPIVYEKLLWEIEHYDKYDDLRDIIYEEWYIGQSSSYVDDRDTIRKARERQIEIIKDIINQNNVFDLSGFLDFLWNLSDEEVLILTQNGNEHTGFNIFSNLFLKDWSKNDKIKEGIKSAFVLNTIQWIKSKDMPFIRIYQSYSEGASMQSTDFFILKSRIPSPVQLHAALSLSEGQDSFKYLMKEIKSQCDLFYHHDTMDRLEESRNEGIEYFLNTLRRHEWILGEPLVLYNDENSRDTLFMVGGKNRFAMGASKVQAKLREDMYQLPFDERLVLDFLSQLDPDFKLKHGDYPNFEKIKKQYWSYTEKDLKLIKESPNKSNIISTLNVGSVMKHLADHAIMSYDHDFLREKTSADKHWIAKYSHNQIKGGVAIEIKGALKIAVSNNFIEGNIKKRWYILLQQFKGIKEEWESLTNEIAGIIVPYLEGKKRFLNKQELGEYIKLLTSDFIVEIQSKADGVTKEAIEQLIENSLNKLKNSWDLAVINTDDLDNISDNSIIEELYLYIEYFMQNTLVYKTGNYNEYSKFYHNDNILIKFLKLTEFNVLGFINRHIKYSSGYKDFTLSEIPKSYYAHHLKGRDNYCFVSAPVYYGLDKRIRGKMHYNEYFKILFDIKYDEFIMPAKIINGRDRKDKINKYLEVIKEYQRKYLQMLKDTNVVNQDIKSYNNLSDERKQKFGDWLSNQELDSKDMEYNSFYILSLIYKNRVRNYKKLNNIYQGELNSNKILYHLHDILTDMETYEYNQFKDLKKDQFREEHDIAANYDEEEMERVGRNWDNERAAHKESVESKSAHIKRNNTIPEELIRKWLNVEFSTTKLFIRDLDYNRITTARMKEGNSYTDYTNFEHFVFSPTAIGIIKQYTEGTSIYYSLGTIADKCYKERDDYIRRIENKGNHLFSDEYFKYANRLVGEYQESYKGVCIKVVANYLNKVKIQYVDWKQSEERNNLLELNRMQKFYKDREVHYRNKRMYMADIMGFLLNNEKSSIVIDTIRSFGATQDEFNDPRYKDKQLRGTKAILTGVPVGCNIALVNTNEYIGRKI